MWSGERGTEEAFEGRQFRAARLLNSPAVDLAAARADHDRRWRREEDAPPRRPVRATRATCSASPEKIARKYEVLDAHCAAVGRDPAEIERSTLQSVHLDSGRRAARRDAGAGRSTASASSGTPAPSTSSSASRDVHDPERIAALAQVDPASLQAL